MEGGKAQLIWQPYQEWEVGFAKEAAVEVPARASQVLSPQQS